MTTVHVQLLCVCAIARCVGLPVYNRLAFVVSLMHWTCCTLILLAGSVGYSVPSTAVSAWRLVERLLRQGCCSSNFSFLDRSKAGCAFPCVHMYMCTGLVTQINAYRKHSTDVNSTNGLILLLWLIKMKTS